MSLKIVLPICLGLLCACSTEMDISINDGDWTQFIYETSSKGVIEINSSSSPTVAFKNSLYRILGDEGELVLDSKEVIYEFDEPQVVHAQSIYSNEKFIFGSIRKENSIPVYRLRFLSEGFQVLQLEHSNVIDAQFIGQIRDAFTGVLLSDTYQVNGQNFTEASVLKYVYHVGIGIDITDTLKFEIPLAGNEIETFNIAAVDDDLFIAINQNIFHLTSTGEIIVHEQDELVNQIFALSGNLVIRQGNHILQVVNKNLEVQNERILFNLINDEENKSDFITLFAKQDRIYLITSLTRIEVSEDSDYAEIPIEIRLTAYDDEFGMLHTNEILAGRDYQNSALITDHFDLISQDVRNGNFGVFLFKRDLKENKFQYLIKKVSF
ncbi:MAG: hypothetical protein JXQ90_01655 [Cyclobacteriaceae bacterium]